MHHICGATVVRVPRIIIIFSKTIFSSCFFLPFPTISRIRLFLEIDSNMTTPSVCVCVCMWPGMASLRSLDYLLIPNYVFFHFHFQNSPVECLLLYTCRSRAENIYDYKIICRVYRVEQHCVVVQCRRLAVGDCKQFSI